MLRKRLILTSCCLAALALIAGSYLLGARYQGPQPVSAQDVSASEAAAPDSDTNQFKCYVNQVSVWNNRMHIRCNPATGDIAYFAYAIDAAHSSQANRYQALAQTAYALEDPVWVTYYRSNMANPEGCLTSDCRGIAALGVVRD